MNARAKAVVKAAQVRGVKSVSNDLLSKAAEIRRIALSLADRGNPDSDIRVSAHVVYSAAELSNLRRMIGTALTMAQGLPNTDGKDAVMGWFAIAAAKHMRNTLVHFSRDRGASLVAFELKSLAHNMARSIDAIKRVYGG